MSDSDWQPARFRDTDVWIRMDANGRPVTDGRGLVEFRYQVQGKSYHTHADRIVPETGAPTVRAATQTPARASTPPRAQTKPASSATRATSVAPGTIEVWTDGACSGNPGPAGLGVHLRDGGVVRELSEYLGEATNNIAELLAIHRGLEMVQDRSSAVAVMSDSEYSLGLLTKGWKPKKNQQIVAELRALVATFPSVSFIKVAGHAGIEGNERADLLARRAIETRSTSRTEAGAP